MDPLGIKIGILKFAQRVAGIVRSPVPRVAQAGSWRAAAALSCLTLVMVRVVNEEHTSYSTTKF